MHEGRLAPEAIPVLGSNGAMQGVLGISHWKQRLSLSTMTFLSVIKIFQIEDNEVVVFSCVLQS